MYKILPQVAQLRLYSYVKKKHHFFIHLTKYLGCHFHNHVLTSILSKAELCADQDGS